MRTTLLQVLETLVSIVSHSTHGTLHSANMQISDIASEKNENHSTAFATNTGIGFAWL